MNCGQVETLICDYVDGTLGAAERAALERHLENCANCAATARDSAEAVQFIGRAAVVEPPQELISRILFDPPWRKRPSGWFAKIMGPLLEPRFAMGMALTVLSFAMIWPRMRVEPSDLSPGAVWAGIEDRVDRLWVRSEKFYDNLKFIYQIRATLREWQQQSPEARPEKSPAELRRVPGPDVVPEPGTVGKP